MLHPLCPHCGSYRTVKQTPVNPWLCVDCQRHFNRLTLEEQNQPVVTTEEARLEFNTFKE